MKNKIILVLIAGLLVRVVLALVTFHSDLDHFYLAGEVIEKGNILSFYDATNIVFNYPPLVYLFLGPLSLILKLPLLKLAYLFFDLAIGLFLYRMFEIPKEKLIALSLWTFNPYNLFATYMMGQFDIIPTFFVILVLYLVKKKDMNRTPLVMEAVLLGLGASFKIFPFLFLFPLALLKDKWIDRAKVILAGLATYFASILLFLGSPGFRATALVATQTTKSLYAKIDISGGEAIILFPLFIILFYILFLYKKSSKETLWKRFFVLLLIFFIFTHYHPQWFLWLSPFLIIDLIRSNFRHLPLIGMAAISWLGLLTFFDPGLTVWLFSPVFPALKGLPGIWELLGIGVDINFARSLLHTVFVSAGLYYIYDRNRS